MNTKLSLALSSCAGLLYSVCGLRGGDAGTTNQVVDPLKLNARTLRILTENRQKQLEAARDWKVFHEVKFSDRCEERGIRCEHHAVDDAAKHWKPAHHEHGTRIAVADVHGPRLP